MNKPLADRIRPTELDDVVGQRHLLEKGKALRSLIDSGDIPNLIFYGPSGVGKTTVASIIASKTNRSLRRLNGTTASTQDIKDIVSELDTFSAPNGILLYLDEIQYFNKRQQQSLLEFIENGKITLIASTTENPYFYIYPAILSRSTVFEFKAVESEDIIPAVKRGFNILSEEYQVELDLAKQLVQKSAVHYDKEGDEHYDIVSAYQKSMRGSDPDAALHYLARLLEAGDLPSACRRLMVCACEDVGLAYPQIIPIVKSAVDIAMAVGMPEARIPLADAVILVATAPKSNSGYAAINKAMADVKNGNYGPIPRQLQNKHYDGEDAEVKGQFYIYPHDYPNHWTYQQYLPDKIKNKKYYEFGSNKNEQAFKSYWDKVKNKK